MSDSILGRYIARQGNLVDEAIERKVQSLLPKGQKITYLDVGCYDGTKTLGRAKVIGTKKVFGIDLPTSGTKKATAKKIKIFFGDLNRRWPVEANFFDCITATEVIEHLIDVDNFMQEVKRILRPGGRVVISTDNLAAWHNIVALSLGFQPYTGPYLSRIYPIGHRPNAKYYKNLSFNEMNPHLNVMTARSLRQLLEVYGLKCEKLLGVGFYPFPPPLSDAFAIIDKYHASHCIALAYKR